ncbi:MAG: hypothetical protein K0R21_1519, partial [Anaerocolumna sp.]|nr:hypothetical protein [Anaerocolumna sp.]
NLAILTISNKDWGYTILMRERIFIL